MTMFGELRKRPHGRPKRRGNNYCKMALQKQPELELTGIASDTVRLWAVVKAAMKPTDHMEDLSIEGIIIVKWLSKNNPGWS